MTDQELESRGYYHFGKGRGCNPFHEDIIDEWQKRFDDEVGKKYFITVHKWDFSMHNQCGEKYKYSFEPETQMKAKGTQCVVNMEFIADDISEVEKIMEDMWNTGMWDYYEKWNE